MDVLKDKSRKDYSYTSRYSMFPYYYNTNDDKYMYGITANLDDSTEYTLHVVKELDSLDSLALKYYGRPDLFWVIADYNRIQDPFIKLSSRFNFIFIPTLSGIRYNKK